MTLQRRGLIRLWIVLSGAWALWQAWKLVTNCIISGGGGFLRCHISPAYFTYDVPMTIADVAFRLVSFPAAAFVAIAAAWWVMRGFAQGRV